MKRFLLAVISVTLLTNLSLKASDASVLKQALQDELNRSMNELALEGVVRPHFIAYTVHADHAINITTSNDGIANTRNSRSRNLEVEMRVGSPELDNSNFLARSTRNRRTNTTLSLEDDYDLLRKQIWLATDTAYKRAVEVYAAKEAVLQNAQRESTRDFSLEEPTVYISKRHSPKLNAKKIRQFIRALSKVGDDQSHIYGRDITTLADRHLDTYLNSEGSYFTRVDDTAFIRATAWTQSADGRFVADYVNIVGRSWEDIADLATVKRKIQAMHSRLKQARDAEPLDRYEGPILFQGQAAAELIGQSLAPNFNNYKKPVFESEAIAAMFNRALTVSSFKERIGARVLPRTWTVYDDPTKETYRGTKLVGRYTVDSDGLKTRRVTLVEEGILKTLLSDRNPTEDIQHSTASNATGSGPTISNLFIETTDGVSDDELKQRLLEIVADNGDDFGVRIERLANPFVPLVGVPSMFLGSQIGQVMPALRAYKVYPNGKEELVRHATVRGNLLRELRNLPGFSESTTLHHSSYIFPGGDVSRMPGNVTGMVSIVTPDILVEEASLSYTEGVVRSLPIIPQPRMQ